MRGKSGAVTAAPLLVATVAAVGVLHTLVPDHWAPIAVIARQRRWSRFEAMRAAAIAGTGHVTSTLALGVVLWALGAAVASRYGHVVNVVAAIALIAFGAWIAVAGLRELRRHDAEHERHQHHDHGTPPGAVSQRTTLLLILGSSPMIEGLPAFLAASTYGAALLVTMALVFAAATIVTYVAVTAAALQGLERISLGPLERYGEVLSGLVVAAVGVYALITA